MTRFINLKIGKIVQPLLNVINPFQAIIWYAQNSETVDDAGFKAYSYTQINLTARIQPVSRELMFKEKLEIGNEYRTFYVLTDLVKQVDRSISTSGDYFKFDNMYWRVIRIPDFYDTEWQQVVCQQTNDAPE